MGYLDKLKTRASENAAGEVKMLPVAALEANKRNFYRMTDIEELSESIRTNGLEQNLVVTPEADGKYRVITGHRRLMALRRLRSLGVGPESVPCLIRPAESEAMEMLRLITSNQYRELTDWEKMTQLIKALDAVETLKKNGAEWLGDISLHRPAMEVVSAVTSMSRTTVNKYALIAKKLLPELAEEMRLGKLAFTVAYTICRYPEKWQRELVQEQRHGEIGEKEVQETMARLAVGEVIESSIGEEIDPDAPETCAMRVMSWCCQHVYRELPGGVGIFAEGGSLVIRQTYDERFSVKLRPTEFCRIAAEYYPEHCRLKKQAEVQPEEEIPPEENVPSEVAMQPEEEVPPEVEVQPEKPTETEEAPEQTVTSAQYGQLLEDLAAETVRPVTRRDPIWRVDAPTEDVQAVAMVWLPYTGAAEAWVLTYDAAKNSWYADGMQMPFKVLGWFPVPRWEV